METSAHSTNIVLLQASARPDGDSSVVSHYIKSTLNCDIIDLLDYTIHAFDYENRHKNDDFLPLISKMIENYKVWIFITPVYWYSYSSRMKIFLDRISDLLKWHKPLGRKMRGKSMGLISVSNDPELQEHFDVPFSLSAEYLGMSYLGHVHSYTNNRLLSAQTITQLQKYLSKIT